MEFCNSSRLAPSKCVANKSNTTLTQFAMLGSETWQGISMSKAAGSMSAVNMEPWSNRVNTMLRAKGFWGSPLAQQQVVWPSECLNPAMSISADMYCTQSHAFNVIRLHSQLFTCHICSREPCSSSSIKRHVSVSMCILWYIYMSVCMHAGIHGMHVCTCCMHSYIPTSSGAGLFIEQLY